MIWLTTAGLEYAIQQCEQIPGFKVYIAKGETCPESGLISAIQTIAEDTTIEHCGFLHTIIHFGNGSSITLRSINDRLEMQHMFDLVLLGLLGAPALGSETRSIERIESDRPPVAIWRDNLIDSVDGKALLPCQIEFLNSEFDFYSPDEECFYSRFFCTQGNIGVTKGGRGISVSYTPEDRPSDFELQTQVLKTLSDYCEHECKRFSEMCPNPSACHLSIPSSEIGHKLSQPQA